ncbi:MAG: hydrolase superfamily [Frankiales bacterium]|nr:hydrolase superfamily [Frankiales bacterium]
MSHVVQVVVVAAVFVLLLVLGLKVLSLYASSQRSGGVGRPGRVESAEIISQAEAEAEDIRQRAGREAQALRRSLESELESLRRAAQTEVESSRQTAEAVRTRATDAAAEVAAEAQREADRTLAARSAASEALARQLAATQATLESREADLASSIQEHAEHQQQLAAAAADLQQRRTGLDGEQAQFEQRLRTELERVAQLSTDEAKVELLAAVEATSRRDAALLVRSIEAEAKAEGLDRARGIVVEAIQRVASEQTTETVVSVLHLPSDEMKGRIIGREGRNIRAFEATTGVNVIIDDTPEAVLLSCFDPVRREVGRITLEKLILDGRIHPHRIEEVYELAHGEVEERCLRAARDALADVGITDIDERLIPTLGRLKYRTSYGQNVLGHLVETAHIAGVMAAELGLNVVLIKRCAFLHDIGKALTHEVEGSHAIIGAEILRRYGESEDVAHAVEAHHNEVQPRTLEAVLTQAADACSASRPGARRESLETYIRRLERIEAIASAKPGVEKVFAMQSGREVRVMVLPNEVDDLAAGVIAREVAKEIEDELTYPGQIRVTVVRESRATEVAH